MAQKRIKQNRRKSKAVPKKATNGVTQVAETSINDVLNDEILFLQSFVRIVDESGKLVPFRLANRPMQQDFVNRVIRPGVPKAVELKARRVGGTSLFMALGLVRCHLRRNYHVLLIAQSDPDARLFMKQGFRKFWDNMHDRIELPDGSLFLPRCDLGVDNDSMMTFPDMGSSISVVTAGSLKIGRGQGYDMIIGTEVARWDVGRSPGTAEETWAMAIGSQADRPHAFAVQESTAYGAAGFFYDTYQKAKNRENGYEACFYDWRCHPNYQFGEDDLRAREDDRGPIELTDAEEQLGISPEQARWRRAMIADLTLAVFWQEYPEDDETCFRVSGDPYFDIEVIDRAIMQCRPVFSTAETGQLRVWSPPRVGEKYIVAIDPGGEGVERKAQSQEPDYDAIGVFDSRMNHVATLHGRWDASTLGAMAVDLAKQYNDALIICEAGPYGNAVLLVIGTVLGYPNLYYERDEHGKPRSAGIKVGGHNKPMLLANLKDLAEHNVLRSDDKKLWGEMRNYHRVPTPSGHVKLEARAGHDDLVMMAAYGAWAWSEGSFGSRRGSGRTTIRLPGKSTIKINEKHSVPVGTGLHLNLGDDS